MAFCVNCGASLDPNASFCTSCGAKVEGAAAAAVPVPEPAPQPQPQPQPAYQQPAPQPAYQQPAYQEPALRNALLDVWKTNGGMTALGIIAIVVISGIAGNISVQAAEAFSLIYVIAALVYAAVVFPSYFTSNPKLADSKIVSLLNGALGGLIFGCLWNSCLTNRKKGVSYIVYIVFCVISLLSVVSALFM